MKFRFNVTNCTAERYHLPYFFIKPFLRIINILSINILITVDIQYIYRHFHLYYEPFDENFDRVLNICMFLWPPTDNIMRRIMITKTDIIYTYNYISIHPARIYSFR